MRHAAKGQWGGGMDLQGSIRQANSLKRVGALFATLGQALYGPMPGTALCEMWRKRIRSPLLPTYTKSKRGISDHDAA